MPVELKVPAVGESITEVQIGEWLKGEGERAELNDAVVVIETDKATVEVSAPISGTVTQVLKRAGSSAVVGEVIGYMDEGAGAASASAKGETKSEAKPAAEAPKAKPSEAPAEEAVSVRPELVEGSLLSLSKGRGRASEAEEDDEESVQVASKKDGKGKDKKDKKDKKKHKEKGRDDETPGEAEEDGDSAALERRPDSAFEDVRVMPAARRALADSGLRAEDAQATGPGGRLLKEDVERAAEERSSAAPAKPAAEEPRDASTAKPAAKKAETPDDSGTDKPSVKKPYTAPPPPAAAPKLAIARPPEGAFRGEEAVPMTPMRRKIAERLVNAQQTAALLTTFNEVDMTAAMALRAEYQEAFQKRYNIKLGFMSFFVKAAVDSLKTTPQVNAEIREGNIVYHNYYDIGIAVGGGKGLVVPVLRNAELMSFSEIELAIADFGKRAQENRIKLEELQGGTFTISNGGIYGSLLSTPIVNPPQSGILGLHAIQKRAVVVNDQIVIRPMMYIAMTYDHRIIDGREAVTFLKRIKECVEAPSRMLLEV